MHVRLYKKNIDRFKCPDNPTVHEHIFDMSKELVAEFDTYNLPEIGEIISHNDKNYVVVNKIRILESGYEDVPIEIEFIYEVEEYVSTRVKSNRYGGWVEDIPLVTQISENKEQ